MPNPSKRAKTIRWYSLSGANLSQFACSQKADLALCYNISQFACSSPDTKNTSPDTLQSTNIDNYRQNPQDTCFKHPGACFLEEKKKRLRQLRQRCKRAWGTQKSTNIDNNCQTSTTFDKIYEIHATEFQGCVCFIFWGVWMCFSGVWTCTSVSGLVFLVSVYLQDVTMACALHSPNKAPPSSFPQ